MFTNQQNCSLALSLFLCSELLSHWIALYGILPFYEYLIVGIHIYASFFWSLDVVTERLKVRREVLEVESQAEETKQEAESGSVHLAEDNAELPSQHDKTKDAKPEEDAGLQGKNVFRKLSNAVCFSLQLTLVQVAHIWMLNL